MFTQFFTSFLSSLSFYVVFVFTLVMIQTLAKHSQTGLIHRDTFCTSETFMVQCQTGEVVIAVSALYGRLEAGRCITSGYVHAMGCFADVTTYIQDACSGRQNCSILVATIDAIAQPCGKDFKSYLDISYKCAPASYLDDCSHVNETVLTQDEGYLALFSAPIRGEATSQFSSCPWILVTSPGRRFNVTWRLPSLEGISDHELIVTSPVELQAKQNIDAICASSWKFVDAVGGEVIHYAACVSNMRKPQERTFQSKSNRLEIHYTGKYYQSGAKPHRLPVLFFKAIGCKDMEAPLGGFTSRHGDTAAVVCNNTADTWYLTCQLGEWVGDVGNCTKPDDVILGRTVLRPSTSATALEFRFENAGIILATCVGILMGGLAGMMLLVAVLALNKSRRRRRDFTRGMTSYHDESVKHLRHQRIDDVTYPALLLDDKKCSCKHTSGTQCDDAYHDSCESGHTLCRHLETSETSYIHSNSTSNRVTSCNCNDDVTAHFTKCRTSNQSCSANILPAQCCDIVYQEHCGCLSNNEEHLQFLHRPTSQHHTCSSPILSADLRTLCTKHCDQETEEQHLCKCINHTNINSNSSERFNCTSERLNYPALLSQNQ